MKLIISPMILVVAIIIAAVIAAILFILKKRGINASSNDALPYKMNPNFLTNAERSFYCVLCHALNSKEIVVFPKVRLADILVVPSGNGNKMFFNKIMAKHVDFLICDTKELIPRFCIELDDISHARPDRIARDEFVDEALKVAGIPIYRAKAKLTYNAGELRATLLPLLRETFNYEK